MSVKLPAFFDVSAKHRDLVRELRGHYPETEEKEAQYKELIKEENEIRNKKREYLFTGTVEKRLGRYSVKYDVVNDWDERVFALWDWKGNDDYVRKGQHYTTQMTFYEDDIELFSSPSFCFLYGDGQTRENTFSACGGVYVEIFNMNNEVIRETCIGGDCFVDFKQVSDKYAIALTQETCTCDPFTCIIYLEDFIFPKENTPQRAYDNARTPMPLTSDGGWLLFVPISAEKDGFRIKNVLTDEILENLVSYEDAYNDKFNWYANRRDYNNFIFQNVIKHVGITEEQATEIMIQNHGTLSIPATEELFAAIGEKS